MVRAKPPITWMQAQRLKRIRLGRSTTKDGERVHPFAYRRITDHRVANTAEQAFLDLAHRVGWHVTKSGWPDFFCVTPDGKLVLVEIKPKGTYPSQHQQAVLKLLALHGLDVRISRGDDLGTPFVPKALQEPGHRPLAERQLDR